MKLVTIVVALLGYAYVSAAAAQSIYDNPNPGGTTVISNSTEQYLSFTPATQVANSQTDYVTELVAQISGGIVYEQTFASAFGSASVNAGISAADAALLVAGPGAVVNAPFLFSSVSTIGESVVSLYSLDPTTSISSPETALTLTEAFGPTTIDAATETGVGNGNPLNPNAGFYRLCNVTSLPSSAAPTCGAVDGGQLTLVGGQVDTNVDMANTYLIDTTTTTTNITTVTSIYDIVGSTMTSAAPEPATWAMMMVGVGVVGAMTRRRPRRQGVSL